MSDRAFARNGLYRLKNACPFRTGVFFWFLVYGGFLEQLFCGIHDQFIVKTRFQIDALPDLAEQLTAQAQDRHIPERQQFPRRP